MPDFSDLRTIPISGTGYMMPVSERIKTYIFTGSGTLSSSYAVTADLANALTATKPQICIIRYKGQFILSGNDLSFFGQKLNQEQASSGNVLLICIYDGSAWQVTIIDSSNDQAPNYEGVAVRPLNAAGGTITLIPGLDKEWQELVGNGDTLVASWNIQGQSPPADGKGGHFFVHYSGTLVPNGSHLTVSNNSLTDDQIIYAQVFVFMYFDVANNVWRSQLLQSPKTFTQKQTLVIPVSFEAAEQCKNSVIAPFKGMITLENSFVTKAIAGTDGATIDVQINGASVTGGALVIPMSSALDTQVTATPSGANTFNEGDIISAAGSKTTAGGKALTSLSIKSIP